MEKTISNEERARRLSEYIKAINGDTTTEEILDSIGDDDGLEGVPSRRVKQATDAAMRTFRGQKPSEEGLYHLEAIVHKKGRPSHLIQDNKFDPFPGEFKYLTDDQAVRKRLVSTLPAIGRIDITDQNTYGGTGFVVGKNLVMTNRHVAELFTTGVGRRVKLQPWGSEVDFREAPGYEEADGYELTKCVMIHPFWDMALFVGDLPDIKPLTLSVDTYEDLLKRKQDVVAIGYPARDRRNGLRAQKEIFGEDFEVKRIAPGKISKRKREIGSKWLSSTVDALAHDASTLGGNSGSAIIDVKNGSVAALHFAGRYLIENYGVPCYELARDPRIVDAGVTFASTVNNANDQLDAYWQATEEGTSNGVNSDSQDLNPIYDGTIQMKAKQNEVTIDVPLRITISLGHPGISDQSGPGRRGNGNADAAVSTDYGDGDDYEVDESTGSGYDEGFLSRPVPVPKLSTKISNDTFNVNGSPLIHYTHFSVCQSKSKRLPRFVAWNIDGGEIKSLSRKGIKFILDSRVPKQFQAGDELYKDNKYDRGHVARRADLVWGPLAEAKKANRDSFFFTNMTPQHEAFNQSGKGGLWGELENAIFEDVNVEGLKISVIGGPIFRDEDVTYRNVKIPADFWKLIAFHDEDSGVFKVAAYIISQKELVFTELPKLDEFHLYQVSLRKLAKETGLDFDEIIEFDSFDSATEAADGSGVREIGSRVELLWV
jgi:endonuclease G, mitochondrial